LYNVLLVEYGYHWLWFGRVAEIHFVALFIVHKEYLLESGFVFI
jgi:hypothetical protein